MEARTATRGRRKDTSEVHGYQNSIRSASTWKHVNAAEVSGVAATVHENKKVNIIPFKTLGYSLHIFRFYATLCASIDDASLRIFYSSRSADANDENYAATVKPTLSTIFVDFEVKIQNNMSITTSVFILDHFQIIISTEDSKKIGACPIKFSTIALHRPPRKILCTCPKRPATHSSMHPFVAHHVGDRSDFLAV